jgi:hypothetical protein
MDPSKASFLSESICYPSNLNQTYHNPPLDVSSLDCIKANRRLPCKLCCIRYHIPHDPRLFPPSPGSDILPLFPISSQTPNKKTKSKAKPDQLKKKEVEKVKTALIAYEKQVWLDERVRLPHRNIPRSFYLPKAVSELVLAEVLKIKSLDTLTERLNGIPWLFRDRQLAKLFTFITTLRLEILADRPSVKKKKTMIYDSPSDHADSDVDMDPVSDSELILVPNQRPQKRAAPEPSAHQPKAKRKPQMTMQEANSFYARPTYSIPKQVDPMTQDSTTQVRRSKRLNTK